MALQSHEVVREEVAIGMEDEEEEDEDENEQHEEEVDEDMQERDDDVDDDDCGRVHDDLAEQDEPGQHEDDDCVKQEDQDCKEAPATQDQEEQEQQEVLEESPKQEEQGEHILQEHQECEKQSQEFIQDEPKRAEEQQKQEQQGELREHEEQQELEEQEELDQDRQDSNEGCQEQGQQAVAECGHCDAGKPVSSKATKRHKKRAARAGRKKTTNDDSAAVAAEPSSSVCSCNLAPGTAAATTSQDALQHGQDVPQCLVSQHDVGKGNPEPVHSTTVDLCTGKEAQVSEQQASSAQAHIQPEQALRESRWAHLQELYDRKRGNKQGDDALRETVQQRNECTQSAKSDSGARAPLPDSQADELAEFTVRLSESAVIAHSHSSGCRRFTVVTPIDSCSTEVPDMLSVNLGAVVLCEAADALGWAFGTQLAPKSLAGGKGCLHYGGGHWRPVVVEVQRARGGFEHVQLSVGTWSQTIESFRGGGTQQRLRQKLLFNRMQAARAAWEAKAGSVEAVGLSAHDQDATVQANRSSGRPRQGKRR